MRLAVRMTAATTQQQQQQQSNGNCRLAAAKVGAEHTISHTAIKALSQHEGALPPLSSNSSDTCVPTALCASHAALW